MYTPLSVYVSVVSRGINIWEQKEPCQLGQGLVFSADNRTRIKEDAESLQCVMLMLDLVRGRCNRFPLHRPSSFPQLLMYFTVFFSLWTSASLYLFSHILSLSLSPSSRSLFSPPPLTVCLAALNSPAPLNAALWSPQAGRLAPLTQTVCPWMESPGQRGGVPLCPRAHPAKWSHNASLRAAAPVSSAEAACILLPTLKAGAERCDARWEPINTAAGAVWLRASPGEHVHVNVSLWVSAKSVFCVWVCVRTRT